LCEIKRLREKLKEHKKIAKDSLNTVFYQDSDWSKKKIDALQKALRTIAKE
jgi:hypothetical protein